MNKQLDPPTLRGLVIQVNHTNYGVLFSAMIKGSGSLICKEDEEGNDLPFLTTEEILNQLMKFGFYVTYDVKSNLPMNMIAFLSTVDNLGYDKITKVLMKERTVQGGTIVKETILVFKSVPENTDILKFATPIAKEKLNSKLLANIAMNVTDEEDMNWDWVKYTANVSDILDENLDPTDDFETQEDVQQGTVVRSVPHGPGFIEHHVPPVGGFESYVTPENLSMTDSQQGG